MATNVVSEYSNYVVQNSATVAHIETAVRILSYLVPGSSKVFSELLYSSSRLLTLVNDTILRQAWNIPHKIPLPHATICRCLTVLDYTEVFLELAAHRSAGEQWRWIVIVCVHVIKAALRFILVRFYDSGILPSPPVEALRRNVEASARLQAEQAEAKQEENDDNDSDDAEESERSVSSSHVTFTLPHSGRTVRSLAATPRGGGRLLGGSDPLKSQPQRLVKTPLNDSQLLGEYMHIARPLLHLFSMYLYGQQSWKPWLVASSTDVASKALLGEVKGFNAKEARELRRRNTMLLCYLLRSPFYDSYTKQRLHGFLLWLSANVPGLRLICKPLLDYLPYWQSVYFYNWAQ